MRLRFQTVLYRVLLALGLAAALFATPAAASGDEQKQGSLELRRVRHVIDGDGKLHLSLQFANLGAKTVNVTGIAPTRFGPWADVNKKVEAGATLKTFMKIARDDPAAVWISTSEGLCVFQLPAKQ